MFWIGFVSSPWSSLHHLNYLGIQSFSCSLWFLNAFNWLLMAYSFPFFSFPFKVNLINPTGVKLLVNCSPIWHSYPTISCKIPDSAEMSPNPASIIRQRIVPTNLKSKANMKFNILSSFLRSNSLERKYLVNVSLKEIARIQGQNHEQYVNNIQTELYFKSTKPIDNNEWIEILSGESPLAKLCQCASNSQFREEERRWWEGQSVR
jgi:hypothetical protein